MEPTTSRLTSHPIRGADPQQAQAVAEHLAHGGRERQTRCFFRLAQHPILVVPRVGDAGQAFEITGEAMGLQRLGGAGYDRGQLGQLLHQLELLGLMKELAEFRSEEPRLNSSHMSISYAVFCLKKKKKKLTFISITPTL